MYKGDYMVGKEKMVYDVIKANPGVQNNDDDLIAAVWRKEGWSDSKTLEDNIARVTRPETITRARRKLHEDGHITYSKTAHSRRTEAFKQAQTTYSKQTFNWFR
jgi:hypothetical protein